MDYIREAVEYLRNYDNCVIALSKLKDEIYSLKVDLKSTKEISYSDMPHGSGAGEPDDVIVNKMFRLQQAESEYKETYKMVKRMDKVLENFKNTNELYYKILKGYFLDHYTEEQLQKDFNYTDRHIRRLKQNGLKVFAIQLFGIKAMK